MVSSWAGCTRARRRPPWANRPRATRARFRSATPIVRMTNTYIANGRGSFEDLIRDVKLGVYACGAFGGQTLLENFSFTAAYGRMIRDGHLAEIVKDVVLAGNLFQTLD